MSEEKVNRTRVIRVRLTANEWKGINQKLAESSLKNVSEYVRKKINDKPTVVYQRNKSLDEFMLAMMQLRKELNAIGNNYNQVVKRLHSMYNYDELKTWMNLHSSSWQLLFKKVEEIKSKISQINQQWLR